MSPTLTARATLTASLSASTTLTITATFTVGPSATPTPTRAFFQQASLILARGLYPNPFQEHLRIWYTLRVDAQVNLGVYNVAGEPVCRLEQAGKAGSNVLVWDGSNANGARCASGAYILRCTAEGVDGTRDSFWERAAVQR